MYIYLRSGVKRVKPTVLPIVYCKIKQLINQQINFTLQKTTRKYFSAFKAKIENLKEVTETTSNNRNNIHLLLQKP